jgi:hypothetical protein
MAIAAISLSDIGHVAALVGGFAGLLAIGAAAQTWWRRTLGRRRDHYARLARLFPGAHLSFFEHVLRESPAMRNWTVKDDYIEHVCSEAPDFYPSIENQTRLIPRRFEVSTFIDRDYYVQAISDDDKKVLAFSVTTRSRGFSRFMTFTSSLGQSSDGGGAGA